MPLDPPSLSTLLHTIIPPPPNKKNPVQNPCTVLFILLQCSFEVIWEDVIGRGSWWRSTEHGGAGYDHAESDRAKPGPDTHCHGQQGGQTSTVPGEVVLMAEIFFHVAVNVDSYHNMFSIYIDSIPVTLSSSLHPPCDLCIFIGCSLQSPISNLHYKINQPLNLSSLPPSHLSNLP